GSGKTTHLKRLLITCWRDSPATLWLSADMVPVFLPLRRFARGRLSDFIDREMNPELLARVGAGFGARLLERGRALLLFDGLDEVADPGQRVEVVRWVEKVAAANPTCVPVVTCRFAGYGRQAGAGRGLEEVRLGEKFLEVHVRPLDRGQTERFVRNWYRIVETGLESDQAKAERRVKVTEKGGVELVEISGGKFLMGSLADEPERSGWEGPVHEVTLSPFWLGRFPVTNKEYGRYLKENPSAAEPALWGDRRFNQVRQPVVGVSWEDAAAFAAWARCRLPTEAEWDYGCRAGTTGMRYAEDLNSIAWYDKNSGGQTHAVGTKTPNAWGLCDMLGNVWEWCADWHGAYDGVAVTNPAGLKGGRGRVGRGGSWFDPAVVCRSAFRYGRLPVDRYRNLGFRLASGQ
ncbi:MAG: SUMF1/EgtB/PvdO family nonheme iron enzyme, partial [Polyangia bacterium]